MRKEALVILALAPISGFASVIGSLTDPGFATRQSYLFNGFPPPPTHALPEGCKPVLLWGIIRHGTRNPGDDEIFNLLKVMVLARYRILESWQDGNSQLDADTIEYLNSWTFPFTLDDGAKLAEAGRVENLEMAQRWGASLDGFIKESDIQVTTSSKSRCEDSGKAFTEGLFGHSVEYTVDDHLARPYDDCDNFLDNVENNNDIFEEMRKFEQSEQFLVITENVYDVTGVRFDTVELVAIWDICRYETAFNLGTISPWCNVFNDEDLELFVYREDLNTYYNKGYAYNITRDMTIPIWRDLIGRMREVESGVMPENSTVLLFTHSTASFPFMSSIGIYDDGKPLLASDWPARDRLWKTSHIGAFASNMVFIAADCGAKKGEEDVKAKNERLNMFFFHQENPVDLPNKIEYLDEFLDYYGYKADLDFDQICAV